MDYKERFKDEYLQLANRVTKLRIMLRKWDNSQLDFEPTCPRKILDEQLYAMVAYLDVLKIRAKIENIDIEIKEND